MTGKQFLKAFLLTLFVIAFAAGGCVTERDPIDKTNPMALDKKLFEGEFFYKQTMTDLPYSIDWSFVGETNETQIIRWEVTESYLIAYSIHDKIDYTNTEGDKIIPGSPVLAYPILDHFDIKLAENSMTGEDLPILTEYRDKPWWQRRYFVIDTSSSAISDFSYKYLNITTIWGEPPFNFEPLAMYHNLEFYNKKGEYVNPREYERAHVEGGDELVDVISWSAEEVVSPNNQVNWNYSWDQMEESWTWENARITKRHYFWRVDREALAKNGFKAMEYQEPMFRRFGYFYRTRRGVDPVDGYRDAHNHHYANYFNTGQNTITDEETGESTTEVNRITFYLSPGFPERMITVACGIAADYNHAFARAEWAKENPGKKDTFPAQVYTEHYMTPTEMTTSAWPGTLDDTVYYYINYLDDDPTHVEEYMRYCFPSDEDLEKAGYTAEGSAEMRQHYFVLRRNELMEYHYDREGVSPEGIPNMISPEEVAEYYGKASVGELNPYLDRELDYPVACQLAIDHRCKIDTRGRKIPRWKYELGDGQTSFIYWVNSPTEYGILGVAQWSDNPETGQIFAGSAHIAGSVLQWSVERDMEIYLMIKGMEDFDYKLSGTRYEQLLKDTIINPEYSKVPQNGEEDDTVDDHPAPPPMNVQRKISALYNSDIALGNIDNLVADSGTNTELSVENQIRLEKYRLPEMKPNGDAITAIRGTPFESMMTPAGLLDAAGYGEDFGEVDLGTISPAFWMSQEGQQLLKNQEMEIHRGCYFQAEWLDSGTLEIIHNLEKNGSTREEIRLAIEKIMFKGVAEHEIGHTLGLRHNFRGSADELNYVGHDDGEHHDAGVGKDSGYWAFKDTYEKNVENAVMEFEQENNLKVNGLQKYWVSKTVSSPRNWFMYSSVMDYMDEFFFHGFGLGRYDLAAFKYVYGKSVEQWRLEDGKLMEYNEPLFEERSCTADDITIAGCACDPYYETGCVCTDKNERQHCFNPDKTITALRQVENKEVIEDGEGNYSIEPTGEKVDIQLADFNRPYMYCNDEWRFEDPLCNVWDKGYTARDVVRGLKDQFWKFFPFRFYRRGNPRFTEYNSSFGGMWYFSMQRLFPFAHFALDLNYNRFQIPSWQNILLDTCTNPNDANCTPERADFLRAMKATYAEHEDALIPGGPGDYLIAAMEGFNFLMYDLAYNPDVGAHVMSSWKEDANTKFFLKNPYIFDDTDLADQGVGSVVNLTLKDGKPHKNHWDFQDDAGIMEPKFDYRGFTFVKDVAMFMLSNTGWFWTEKYGYENMANGFAYLSDGFENSIYQMFGDVANEDHMWSFSTLCWEQDPTDARKYTPIKYLPPVNSLYFYGWTEDIGGDWQPPIYESDISCNQLGDSMDVAAGNAEGTTKLIPTHASWIYFDKWQPLFYALYGMNNLLADNTANWYFRTESIPVGQHHLWEPVDGVTSTECLNQKENLYYRAYKAPGDDHISPIFNTVERCRNLLSMCIIDPAKGLTPGNLATGDEICGPGYPRWYLDRDLQTIESTFIFLDAFINFWTDMTPW